MNLLILVAAIFAIVSFFMFKLGDIAVIDQSRLHLSRIANQANTLVNSPVYCDSAYYFLPNVIRVPGKDLYYKLKVAKANIEKEDAAGEKRRMTYVIFSIFRRVEEDKAVAADSFLTPANVVLFTYEGGEPEEVEATEVDPQAETPMNAFVLIKEVITPPGSSKSEPFFYFIPCSTDKEVCNAFKAKVAESYLKEKFNRDSFFC